MSHSRDAYNVLKLLAAFGALYSMIFSSLEGVGKFINSKIIRAKFIRALYFVESDENHSSGAAPSNIHAHSKSCDTHSVLNGLKTIKFTWRDKFHMVYNLVT